MRHVFRLNPAAGKKRAALRLMPQIQEYFSLRPAEYRIHVTNCPGDATEVAAAEAEAGVPVRLYACGGDGTLMETMNGIIRGAGTQGGHVELASVPCGSGNDYVKAFGTVADFSLDAVIEGTAVAVDGIRCYREAAGKTDYSLNIASIGMDASVGLKMNKYKNKPLVSGPMAYNLAVADVFVHKLGSALRVSMETTDGLVETEGDFLFVLAASGKYYGGGYCGAPQADPADRLLDFVTVDTISRPRILRFLGIYKAGKHLDLDFVHTWRGAAIRVQAAKPLVVNMDGECFTDTGVSFELVPEMCRFVLPRDLLQ
ncbi:MAG: hypothetical protein FWE80_10495 [Oscillospiraceae bacterium]|nr:hypothetical protein [Oscillospiraceae bacterium]